MATVCIGFKDWKADFVERGLSRQTIRGRWKRPVKVGDTLKFYRYWRTKNARRFGTATCTAARPIRIGEGNVILDGIWLSSPEADSLADRDGFADQFAMRSWFREQYGLPFEGVVIEWGELREKGG